MAELTPFLRVLAGQRKIMRERIVDYLLIHHDSLERTQINIMRALGISQATLVKYLAELRGEGLIVERPFGTAVIYEIQYDVAITKGMAKKFEIFDLDSYLAAHRQQNQEWKGMVFDFKGMVYIFVRHISGSIIGIPIYDTEWEELIRLITIGLNLEALLADIGRRGEGNG